MYPLLLSGVTSVATNLIDSYNRAADRKMISEKVKFDEIMNRASGIAQNAAAASVPTAIADPTAGVRGQVLNSPEVKSAIDAADPSKPLQINVSADGRVTLQSGDGAPRTIALSPATSQAARELGAMMTQGAPSSSVMQAARASSVPTTGSIFLRN